MVVFINHTTLILADNTYEVVNMIKKVIVSIFIFLLVSTNAIAQTNQQIEIFDINKGKVVMNVPLEPVLQQEAKKWLKGITGVYVKFKPIPDKGFMVKVPLQPNVMVENQWFNDLVDEVIIIFPYQEKPYLLIFDSENKPYFFTFEADTDKFLEIVNKCCKSTT
jgi:hypothetical protein